MGQYKRSIRKSDLKEFIRLLKKRFCLSEEPNCTCARCKTIDNLAGDNLK